MGIAVVGLGVVLLSRGALGFQCPVLIRQSADAIAKEKDEARRRQALDLVLQAQQLHDAGRHGDSVAKANEALRLLGVSTTPAQRY